MKKSILILSCALLFTASNDGETAFGQGFGGYVAPTSAIPAPNLGSVPTAGNFAANPASSAPLGATGTTGTAPRAAFVAQNILETPSQTPTAIQTPVSAGQNLTAQNEAAGDARSNSNATAGNVANSPVAAPNVNASANAPAPQGGVLSDAPIQSAIVPPPANYQLTENEQIRLDEFLTHWENFGKGIKRISCDVHMKEFDGGLLQQDAKKPVAHTWGQFRFISPNKLLYHVKGEFFYPEEGDPVWKNGQNEWEIVLDGKSLTQYDYKNKRAVVYPIVKEEQNIDLTMDNGQFPLFFVAKADVLKSRFYMRLVTPKSKLQSEVWIEAFPRYARDAQQFRSIVVILGLKDMQPTYMRKNGVNGKSKTDLVFENVSVNKGKWDVEGTVEPGWTKDVREDEFSLLQQQPTETNVAQTPQNVAGSQNLQAAATRSNGAPTNGTQYAVVSPENASKQGVARVASKAGTTPTSGNGGRRY